MREELKKLEWPDAIRKLRQRAGLSQSEFGARLHYSAMAVSRWETGKQEPSSRCFIQLGNMAGEPDCWLYWARAGLMKSDLSLMFPGAASRARLAASRDFEIVRAGASTRRKGLKRFPKLQMVAVPLLEVHAGTLGQEGGAFVDFNSAETEEMIAAPAFWCPNPAQTNCLRVKGTSMTPLIHDGDIVAVDAAQAQVDPKELTGKIVVAWHRISGLALAHFVAVNGVHLLQSENREYAPVNIDKDKKWQIIGKVLWWVRKAP